MAIRKTDDTKQAIIACLIKYHAVIPSGSVGTDWPATLLSDQDHEFWDVGIKIKINQNEESYYLPVNRTEFNQKSQDINIDSHESLENKTIIMIEGYLLTTKGRIFDIIINE